MIVLILIVLYENLLLLHGRLYQGQYHRLDNCANSAPSATSIFATEDSKNSFTCAKSCQVNVACRSFSFIAQVPPQCLQSRSTTDDCDDLDTVDGAVTYKIETSDFKELAPDLYFPFDDVVNGTLRGDIDATLHNNPTLVPGVRNNAMFFNGVNQSADLGIHRCFSDITQCIHGYSFAIWIKVAAWMLDPSINDRYILSSGGQTRYVITGGMALSTIYGNLRITFKIRDTAGWTLNTAIQGDRWYHIAATWYKEGNLTGYIDGVVWDRVGPYSPLVENATVASLMTVGVPNNAYVKNGEVTVDDWYFWEKVLTDEDIEILYSMYFI